MISMGLSLAQKLGLFGGDAPDAPQLQRGGGISISPTINAGGMQPSGESKIADAQVQANLPLTPTEAGKFGTGELLAKGGKGFDKVKGKGPGLDESLQMAALAAQLGSVLFPGGQAPPPPGLPRGGGIGMKPVFQNTARDLYGG
jgi:hypothetical protein